MKNRTAAVAYAEQIAAVRENLRLISEALQEPEPTEPEEAQPAPVHQQSFVASVREPRLPPVGSVITRNYKGAVLQVTVLESGFECGGEIYSSISKLAKVITGHQAINGYQFFKLGVTPGGKGHSGAGLQGKINKLERLTAKLRAALAEGGLALADGEAEVERMKGEASQGTQAE